MGDIGRQPDKLYTISQEVNKRVVDTIDGKKWVIDLGNNHYYTWDYE